MRILYLAHRVPYAPNRGDRIRAYHTLQHLRRCGFDVHVVALAHDAAEAAHASEVRAFAAGLDVVTLPRVANRVRAALALGGRQPLTHVLLHSPAIAKVLRRARETFQPDLVLALCSGMAKFALEAPLRELPFVLDMVDVDSEKWRALAGRGPRILRPIYAREARLLEVFERRAATVARSTLVVNERERASMARIAPAASVIEIPNGIDLAYFRPTGSVGRRPEVVFVGVFDYAPNAAGADWLLREVWPKVRAARPDATLALVGSQPSRALRRAASEDSSVTVTGAVPDVRPYLWRATVSAAPIFVARGLQNKVLEALAARLRVVTTTCVASGLPAALAACCQITDDAAAFAQAVIGQLDAGDTSGCDDQLAPYQWEGSLSALGPLLESHAAAVRHNMGSTVT